MKCVRLFLYFVIGFLLSACAVLAHAETIPATLQTVTAYKIGPIVDGTSYSDACTRFTAAMGFTFFEVSDSGNCRFLQNGSLNNQQVYTQPTQAYRCPTGQNWTLSGSSCQRPDCVAPQVRQSDGTCESVPDCKGNQSPMGSPKTCQCNLPILNFISGPRPWLSGAGSIPSTVCDGGCTRNLGFGLGGGGTWTAEGGAFSGETCTEGEKSPSKPPVPNHKPACAATEGVMTSSSGTVACVPEGTPDARKPQVEKKQKVEQFPDGTAKTTEETTTKDPATGATHTASTSTATGKADGTAGQAGAVGTTSSDGSTGTGSSNGGNGSGDKCEGNDCGAGKEFPETGELWKKKYPNGISGVLNEKFTAIKASSLGGLVGQLAPNLPNTGACPSWSFAMNIGQHMNFGGASLNMPCGVWSFVRIVLLITAALVARRLIFGG